MKYDIKVPSGTKIAVVGDIHAHDEQFNKILEEIKPSEKMWFVSVGDIYDKGFGAEVSESIVDKIAELQEKGFGFIVRGNHELKYIKRAKQQKNMTKQLLWLEKQPLTLPFVFENGTRLTVLHGGVNPTMQWEDILEDIEIAYIRDLDSNGKMIKLKWQVINGKTCLEPAHPNGKPWHDSYDGVRFGYIASGHNAQKDGIAKFYNYSCNLDSACYATGILSCQIFSESGLDRFITVTGKAARWQEE